MALYSKHEIVAKVVEVGLIPTSYHSDLEIAKKVSETVVMTGDLTPTKGVVHEWIGAGTVVLNMGTSLLRPDLINAGDHTSLRKMVEQYLQHIREAKFIAKRYTGKTIEV